LVETLARAESEVQAGQFAFDFLAPVRQAMDHAQGGTVP
jgi:hypothetical protein